MATKVYGTIDPETGNTIETRSIQSPITRPKIESTLEKENIGFWEKHFDWVQGPGDIYNFWSKGEGAEAIGGAAGAVGRGVSGAATAVGKGLTSGLGKITILAIIIAAIVIVPRILPKQ